MPCVLPVIGLKLLSFLEQGGGNPRRVLALIFGTRSESSASLGVGRNRNCSASWTWQDLWTDRIRLGTAVPLRRFQYRSSVDRVCHGLELFWEFGRFRFQALPVVVTHRTGSERGSYWCLRKRRCHDRFGDSMQSPILGNRCWLCTQVASNDDVYDLYCHGSWHGRTLYFGWLPPKLDAISS